MDWKLIMIQALASLIAKYGPGILDAIGELLIALIKSLTPKQTEELVAMLTKDTLAQTT